MKSLLALVVFSSLLLSPCRGQDSTDITDDLFVVLDSSVIQHAGGSIQMNAADSLYYTARRIRLTCEVTHSETLYDGDPTWPETGVTQQIVTHDCIETPLSLSHEALSRSITEDGLSLREAIMQWRKEN